MFVIVTGTGLELGPISPGWAPKIAPIGGRCSSSRIAMLIGQWSDRSGMKSITWKLKIDSLSVVLHHA